MDRKEIFTLIGLYTLLVTIKVILAYFIQSPSIFSDEYLYQKLARNIFYYGEATYHSGIEVSKYPLLYPFIISFAFIFKDMQLVYFAMKLINVLLLTLSIFPIYLLAREFLSKKKSLLITIIASTLPVLFNFSNYLLSENLYYSLFLFEIYFIYKAFKTNKPMFFILSGIFLALSFWTRILAMTLIPVVFIVYLFYRKKAKILNIFYHYFTALVLVSPLIYRSYLTFGTNVKTLSSGYRTPSNFFDFLLSNPVGFLNWGINYAGYLIIATGFVFGIYYFAGFFVKKDKNFVLLYLISTVTILFNLIVVANQANAGFLIYSSPFFSILSNRPIGRYLEACVPIVLLIGFIIFTKFKFSKTKQIIITLISSLILLISTQLTIAPLFPVNNQSLTNLGVFDALLELLFYGKMYLGSEFFWAPFLVILFCLGILPWIIFIFKNRRKWLISFAVIIILSSTFLSYGFTFWSSNYSWSNTSQTELAIWFEDYPKEKGQVLLIDEKYCNARLTRDSIHYTSCDLLAQWSLFSFWTNMDIIVGESTNIAHIDYIYTRDSQLPYPLIQSKDGFLIYEVKK